MAIFGKTRPESDSEIVRSTLTEIVLIFLFLLLFLMGALVAENAASEEKNTESDRKDSMIHELRKENGNLKEQIHNLQSKVLDSGKAQVSPFFDLKDTGDYRFPSCGYELSKNFVEKLKGVVANKISKIITDHQMKNPAVDIIGHTDEQTLTKCKKLSNMDFANILPRNSSVAMNVSSNIELGMARALQVTKVLNSIGDLSVVKFRPMSAGQYIDEGGNLIIRQFSNSDEESRRRIEIRIWESSTSN